MADASVIEAAEAAINAHTEARGLDDEGRPAEIGMWHLLVNLMQYSHEKGVDFDEILADAKRETAHWLERCPQV